MIIIMERERTLMEAAYYANYLAVFEGDNPPFDPAPKL
jgi:hypothetical protein